MANDRSNVRAGDTPESLKAERENLEQTIASMRQLARDADAMKRQRKSFDAERVADYLQVTRPDMRIRVWAGIRSPEGFQWHKQWMARKKAKAEQSLPKLAAFTQAVILWVEDLERREKEHLARTAQERARDPANVSSWVPNNQAADIGSSSHAIPENFTISGFTPKTPAEIIEYYGGTPETASSLKRNDLEKYNSFDKWMQNMTPWSDINQLRRQYPGMSDDQIFQAAADYANIIVAHNQLIEHGLGSHKETQAAYLRLYMGMLDLTTVAASIPLEIPSADNIPWIGRNLSTQIADSGALYPPINPVGPKKGPVIFKVPSGATDAEVAEMRAYIHGANDAWRQGNLAIDGRVSTAGALRTAANNAAAEERASGTIGGTPYAGFVGHVPDTTWTGDPEAFIWLDQTGRVNSSLGAQAARYPIGFKPTGFTLEGD